MGVARVECRSGCRCEPTTIDSTWDKQVSLQQIHMFRVSQHEACVMRVTIVEERGEAQSDGHKVRRAGVVCVGGWGVGCGVGWVWEKVWTWGSLDTSTGQLAMPPHPHTHIPLLLPPRPQVQLMAVMVTQFPIRLTVYAAQVEDVAANKVSSSSSSSEGSSDGGGGKGADDRR